LEVIGLDPERYCSVTLYKNPPDFCKPVAVKLQPDNFLHREDNATETRDAGYAFVEYCDLYVLNATVSTPSPEFPSLLFEFFIVDDGALFFVSNYTCQEPPEEDDEVIVVEEEE
ncbi:hypothetical protein OESDEN_18726, partial [Oesophagostomum dentatum]